MGEIECRRAYYYCGRCGQGEVPWDAAVGLTSKQLTPGAEEAVSLAGTVSNSFAEAAEKVLPRLAGLRLAETTVERTTEAAGERVGKHLAKSHTFGARQDWAWHLDADGRTCAYVGVDATSVRQQAPDGGKADGRMPYVGMVYNPVPEVALLPPHAPKTMQARYLAGLYSLDDLGLQLRRQASQVGMDRAERWLALSDGGNGLEEFLQVHFPRVEAVILDFYHAAQHLADLAKTWHPADEERSATLTREWCRTMKEHGGQEIIAVLEELALPPRRPALVAKHAEVLNYLRNQVHRMDYPRYLAKGWFIGSGPVESACKTVVGQRLKLAGMRWGQDGTDAMCHLRALFKSERGQWAAFWRRHVNVRSTN